MKKELQNKLYGKYPEIFARKNSKDSCMSQGITCGDGWYNILEELCNVIQNEISLNIGTRKQQKTTRSIQSLFSGKISLRLWWLGITRSDIPELTQPEARQVKEKFGGLRFYHDGGNSRIDGMVKMAEAMASRTCEKCGAPGTKTLGGWIRTLCKNCR